jgi:RHS repeat-associated protein
VTSRACGGVQVNYVWFSEVRLSEWNRSGVGVQLHYDAFGRLVRYDSAGAVKRHFLWDGENLFAELDGSGAKLTEFSYYPGLDRLHAFVLASDPGRTFYAHRDAMGNTIVLTDQTGALMRSYRYDAWGKVIDGSDLYGFGGRDRVRWKGALWFDQGEDVYYMRARWYDVKSGRFLSEDPAGLTGGINPYVFAEADPILGADPTGLQSCPVVGYLDANGRITYSGVTIDAGPRSAGVPVLDCNKYGQTYSGFMTAHWGDQAPPNMGLRAFQACDDPNWSDPQCRDSERAAPPRGPSCSFAWFNFGLTFVTDITFFTGIGVGLLAARGAARFAARAGDFTIRAMWDYHYQAGARAIADAGAALRANGVTSRLAYGGAMSARLTGSFSQIGSGLVFGGISVGDFIPGIASYNALKSIEVACR